MMFQQVVLLSLLWSCYKVNAQVETNNHLFHPIHDTTVSGPCEWEIWTSKNSQRIPSEITEIYCSGTGMTCDRNPMYQVVLTKIQKS